MASRSGGSPIKNVNKVKPGHDQAFTLPKGTSAAPIMQVRLPKAFNPPKFKKIKNKLIKKSMKKYPLTSLEKVFLGQTIVSKSPSLTAVRQLKALKYIKSKKP
jgi:ribosomal protein L10